MRAGNSPSSWPGSRSDSAVKKEVRAKYSRDGETLIEAAGVIAMEFATIAAANNYWRE